MLKAEKAAKKAVEIAKTEEDKKMGKKLLEEVKEILTYTGGLVEE